MGFDPSVLIRPLQEPLERRALLQPLAPGCLFVHPPARSGSMGSWSQALAARDQECSNPSSLGRPGSHVSPLQKVGR